ncbi:hypothetical protein [Victivallis vadensis]|uniref:hypothetical protein n=1 Tax=Victivallis vadensis TaxID=172901 RepID=UPI003AF89070
MLPAIAGSVWDTGASSRLTAAGYRKITLDPNADRNPCTTVSKPERLKGSGDFLRPGVAFIGNRNILRMDRTKLRFRNVFHGASRQTFHPAAGRRQV